MSCLITLWKHYKYLPTILHQSENGRDLGKSEVNKPGMWFNDLLRLQLFHEIKLVFEVVQRH